MAPVAKPKHVPMRTCIATGAQKPKNEMVRLVRLPDPDSPDKYVVKIDLKGKERGRGASIDSNLEAFDLAVKKKAIERALKLERALQPTEVEQLRSDFANALEEKQFRQGNRKVVFKISKAEMEAKLQN